MIQQVRGEKLAELEKQGISLSSFLFNYGFGIGIGGGPLAGFMGRHDGPDDALNEEERMKQWIDEDLVDVPVLEADSEEKLLGLTWWVLYVGWKDVSERVMKEVEAVFRQ
jgi:hypothetical protein